MRTDRWRVGVLLAVLAVVSGGCAGEGDAGGESKRAEPVVTGGGGAAYPAARATVGATVVPDQRPVTIAFAGDVHFEAQLRSRLDDPPSALEPIADELGTADLTVLNLESAVGSGGIREDKRFTFQSPPEVFDALAAAGVDAVSMANNHAGDYGFDGLDEALAAADGTLEVVGVGSDVDAAFAPARFDIDGTTVAVFAASAADHDPTADPTGHWAAGEGSPGVAGALDPARLIEAVEAARPDVDVIVAYLHWGIQGDSCPSDAQVELAESLAEAEADIVVGSHTHRLQGAGTVDGGTYLAYGLGNFVWYTQASEASTATGVLTLTVEDGDVVDEAWAPAIIESDGLPRFTGDPPSDLVGTPFGDLRECAGLAPVGG